MSKNDLCLVKLEVVKFKAANTPGSLFFCPNCGLLDTEEKADGHIWNVKQPLLERLGLTPYASTLETLMSLEWACEAKSDWGHGDYSTAAQCPSCKKAFTNGVHKPDCALYAAIQREARANHE